MPRKVIDPHINSIKLRRFRGQYLYCDGNKALEDALTIYLVWPPIISIRRMSCAALFYHASTSWPRP